MQSQPLQPSWPYYNNITNSSFDEACLPGLDMDFQMGDCDFSSSFTTTEDSSDGTSSILYFPTMNPDELLNLPIYTDHDLSPMFPLEQYSSNFEDLCPILNYQVLCDDDIEDVQNLIKEEYEGSQRSSSMEYSDTWQDKASVQQVLVLPSDEMEMDNKLSIFHLLKAYGEAMENNEAKLVDVILKKIKEKVSPRGETLERLGYYLFQAMDKQADYLKQESSKNYDAAFRAFYEIFPYGRFAHFTTNLAILEAIPKDAEMIHIIDFDMGEGVQWPPLIEAIGRRKSVRLTSIKWKDTDCGSVTTPQLTFEETRRRLNDHAHSLGLNLEVEEMDMEELMREKLKMKKLDRGREWMAFNCMVGLPHMRSGSRREVKEFLKVAKDLINNSIGSRGIITFGDGEDLEERMRNCCGFGSFFDGYLLHFHALFESMEWNFPTHLIEARMAMECLFVAPYASSLACFDNWEESSEGFALQSGNFLEGLRFSKDNLMQAKEMVKEGESLYGVRVEGGNMNVMALEWRGTPLVRLSTWR